MKTLEFKLNLDSLQKSLVSQWLSELSWAWNEGLKLLLEFHQHKYYDFLLKEAEKRGISMDGIDMVRLSFPKHSAWSLPMMPQPDRVKEWLKWKPDQTEKFVGIGGATCRIAQILDDVYTPIAPDDRLQVCEARLKSASDTSLSGYFTKTRLNELRTEQGLEPLTVHSDYIGGVFKQLATSWKSYCDPKIRHAHKPKFRGGRNSDINSLFGLQPECLGIEDKKIKMPGLGLLEVVGLRLPKRLKEGISIRSAILKQEPSGYYACLSVAHPVEIEKQQIKRELTKVRSDAKKQGSKLLPEVEAVFKEQVKRLDTAIVIHQQVEAKIKPSSKIVGIDPGVKALIATDNGRLYSPNKELNRKERKLKRLQRKASRQYQKNKDNPNWKHKNHDKTQHEIALQWEKIRRSRSAYTHKLSTKLVREFDTIAIEDTQLTNMVRAAKPKVNESATGYDRNNRKAKAGLNRSILNSCIGQLRDRIETKAEAYGRRFLKSKAHLSSQTCHACKELGDRPKQVQNEFYCRNPHCIEFNKRQHADVNAARNHLIGAIEEFTKSESNRGLARERTTTEPSKPGCPVISPECGTTSSNAGETLSVKGTPQEAVNASDSKPSSEHDEQSTLNRVSSDKVQLRESLAVPRSNAPESLDPLPSKGQKRRKRRSTRDPDVTQLLFNLWGDDDQETG